MTDKDEQLLEAFFRSARQKEIADEGFTERVMSALSSSRQCQALRLSQLWTVFCMVVGAGLFIHFDGWKILIADLLMVISTIQFSNHLLTLLICMLGLGCMAISEAVNKARPYL